MAKYSFKNLRALSYALKALTPEETSSLLGILNIVQAHKKPLIRYLSPMALLAMLCEQETLALIPESIVESIDNAIKAYEIAEQATKAEPEQQLEDYALVVFTEDAAFFHSLGRHKRVSTAREEGEAFLREHPESFKESTSVSLIKKVGTFSLGSINFKESSSPASDVPDRDPQPITTTSA